MTPAPNREAWAVYLLECTDGRVYTGIARDPEQRYAKHLAGKGARFTRANPPRRLLGWVWVADHGAALRLEIAWKKLPRRERVAALHAHLTIVCTLNPPASHGPARILAGR
ncbi:MAG: GIY-YIG nuclease family protein [Xanthomonadales bacterium]|nr:GIY-YIG nuclease family protein [Xanthomonadales bacterium]